MKSYFVIAALATLATVAQAQQGAGTSAAAAPASSASLTTAPTSAGSTTATLEQQKEADAKKSKWSFSTVWQAVAQSSELNYSNRQYNSVSTTDLVGLGYKIDKDNSVGFKQYFTVNHDGATNKNTSDLLNPVLTYGHTFKGFAKSEDISALFWYYIPVTANDYKTQNNGSLRLDAELAWTLTPKWQVSYYFNPRQSLIPSEEVSVDAKGKKSSTFAKTTLIHYGTLYYNLSDATTFYTNVGFIHRWNTRSSDFAIVEDKYITNLGASFNFFGGKLNLNPEIDYEVDMPGIGSSANIASTSTYSEANLSYVLQAAVVF